MTDLLIAGDGRPRTLDTWRGRAEVRRLERELDQLVRECGAPVTTGAAWVSSRIDHTTGVPWAVGVRDPDGALSAIAVLLDLPGDEDGAPAVTVLASGGDGHRACLPARDEGAARALAVALAGPLRRRRVALGPLSPDAATQALIDALGPDVAVTAADPIPSIVKVHGSGIAAYLSTGCQRTLRKSRNRLEADGRAGILNVTTDPDVIEGWLPDLASAYRDRDRHHGLVSELADTAGYLRWSDRVRRLARTGGVEVSLLHISDVLAAYLIGVIDGGTYRVVEGRFVSAWARYSPGRLLESAVLQRVLDDDGLGALDWMTGVAPQALLAANATDEVVVLTVGS